MVIFVGNLGPDAAPDVLRGVFSRFGPVDDVTLVRDRISGRMLGFGFVVMPDASASEAVAALNHTDIGGSTVIVAETPQRSERRETAET